MRVASTAFIKEVNDFCFSIKDDHASLVNEGGNCKVIVSANSRVLVNGEPVLGEITLHHQDR